MHGRPRITPELLLRAYAEGVFPMAERRDSHELYWVSPERRGIIPLDTFHIPRRLARTVRSDRFTVTSDFCFVELMRAAHVLITDSGGVHIPPAGGTTPLGSASETTAGEPQGAAGVGSGQALARPG